MYRPGYRQRCSLYIYGSSAIGQCMNAAMLQEQKSLKTNNQMPKLNNHHWQGVPTSQGQDIFFLHFVMLYRISSNLLTRKSFEWIWKVLEESRLQRKYFILNYADSAFGTLHFGEHSVQRRLSLKDQGRLCHGGAWSKWDSSKSGRGWGSQPETLLHPLHLQGGWWAGEDQDGQHWTFLWVLSKIKCVALHIQMITVITGWPGIPC